MFTGKVSIKVNLRVEGWIRQELGQLLQNHDHKLKKLKGLVEDLAWKKVVVQISKKMKGYLN